MKTDTVLIVGAVGIGLYVIAQAVKGLGNIKDTLNDAGAAIGSGLFNLFHPDPVGETLYYTPTFPDGRRHAVPSRSVSRNGQFTLPEFYGPQRWLLLTSKQDGKRYAAKI
jgi:hypothetical protein